MKSSGGVGGAAALSILAIGYAAVVPPAGPRSIPAIRPGPHRDLELRMWQAYYAKQRTRLFGLLVMFSARAVRLFLDTGDDRRVPPGALRPRPSVTRLQLRRGAADLERAYTTARPAAGRIRSREVARAELAWWSRAGRQGTTIRAGRASHREEYALLYEAPPAT